ncbi:MAG: hypothetical protein J6R85_01220 [Lentisphaeria bacterium]|nr:hypothetical protein [Lentisphaeria bacterium]
MLRIFSFLLLLTALSAAEEVPPPLVYTPRTAETEPIRETGLCRTLPDGSIQWTPSPDPFRAAGGARIPAAVMLADGSLWIAETVGAPRGPFAARLAVFPAECSAPVKVFRRDHCRIVSLFDSHSNHPGILLELAENRMQEWTIVPETGEFKAVSGELPAISSRAQWGEQRFYAAAGQKEVIVESPEGSRKITVPFAGGRLLALPGCKTVLLFRGNPAEILRLSPDGQAFLPVSNLPPEQRPEFAIAADPEGKSAFFWAEGGNGFWWDGLGFYPVAEDCGSSAVLNPVNGNLTLLKKQNRILEIYLPGTPPSFCTRIESGRLKPVTRGDYRFLFPAQEDSSNLTVLDSRGNLFTLEPGKGKRWIKSLRYESGI